MVSPPMLIHVLPLDTCLFLFRLGPFSRRGFKYAEIHTGIGETMRTKRKNRVGSNPTQVGKDRGIDEIVIKCNKLERGECPGEEPCATVQKVRDATGNVVVCDPASRTVYVWDGDEDHS